MVNQTIYMKFWDENSQELFLELIDWRFRDVTGISREVLKYYDTRRNIVGESNWQSNSDAEV